ncbi:hypothetical protein AJ78_02610 [Emergomyces pasteurianus Ep9510]|uniref:FAD dependent oxidoreductase domain-containing protein n=1 Tax=Emergomyces pasteurianus Ep9510 TaxID=1447872 RepID=A0A1J9QN37_9EURO|nr:hypothetical protein AJ78_02610 [Emergomyces pasteurianus Ep9510]
MATSTPKPFPMPNGMRSFWHSEPDSLENYRSSENLPRECDILIIGAGYAGVSTAYHILQDNPSPPSVIILEARQVCFGATGRNGGHIRPSPFLPIIRHADKHGLEAASELSNFEAEHIPAIRDVIEKEGIECDFNMTRSFEVLLREDHCKKVEKAFNQLVKSGVSLKQDVQYTSKNAERISGVKSAKGCFHYTAAHIWPYKFVLHLLSTLLSRFPSSVNLQTNTPVTGISETPEPTTGEWTVTTESRGSIKAKKVILATNAYTAAIAPQYTGRIVPVRGICSHIVTPAERPAPYLPNTYSLQWGAEEYDYLIPRPDGSIVVGGGRRTYVSDLKSWYGNTNDTEPIKSGESYFDGYMQRHFIGWEDSDAYTEQVWSGVMGYSTDLLPHAGPIPDKPNQYILAGFSGHGMPMAFLTAKGIARMVRNVDNEDGNLAFEDTGIPRLYRTTRERLESTRNEILTVNFGIHDVEN